MHVLDNNVTIKLKYFVFCFTDRLNNYFIFASVNTFIYSCQNFEQKPADVYVIDKLFGNVFYLLFSQFWTLVFTYCNCSTPIGFGSTILFFLIVRNIQKSIALNLLSLRRILRSSYHRPDSNGTWLVLDRFLCFM